MSISSDNTDQKPICVVIDTNIWRSDLLLKTPVGVSLVYTLGRQGGFIGLPEVVEGELTNQVVQAGLKAVEELEKWSRIINTLTGSSFDNSLPDQIELKQIVDARIAELAPILVRVPFTLEHAKAALDMVNAKLPPNGPEDQQFKDSALWQAVLQLSRQYTVHLITNDRAFLLDRKDPTKGLAQSLQEDCQRVGGSVAIYCDLGSCLNVISGDVPSLDNDHISSLIVEIIMEPLRTEATRNRFEIKELLGTDITAFRTGHPNRLAVDYAITMRFDLNLPGEEIELTDCQAITHGSCYYEQGADCLSGNFIEYITFAWKFPTGGHGRITRSLQDANPAIPFRRPIKWS